jgi:hypothetical protein
MVSKIYKNLHIFGIQHISLLTIPTTIVVSHYRRLLLLLMMRIVVLYHSPLPPSMSSTSFLRMHQWHSDLLHCDTSRWCNP